MYTLSEAGDNPKHTSFTEYYLILMSNILHEPQVLPRMP